MKILNPTGLMDTEQMHEGKLVEKEADVRIRLVTDEKLFIKVAGKWEKLADSAAVPVYSRFEWLFCWWKHFGRHPKRKLYILAVYHGRQLIGIAPFYTGESSIGPLTLQKRLHLMGCGTGKNEFLGFLNDYGYSDFQDIIAHPEYRKLVAESIADVLNQNPVNVDLICFHHIRDDSFVMQELLPCLEDLNIKYQREKSDECPFLTLPDTLDEYIEQTGPSSRRRRLRKNLEAAGKKYSIEVPATTEELHEGLELLFTQHAQRWNSIGFPGAFYDHRHLNFVREISQVMYHKGWLWFKFAIDQNGFSAIRMAINDGNAFYDWLSGFDDTAPSSKFRPGLGLLAIMIREAIESKASKVELLRGSERYKYDFTSESRQNWRVTLRMHAEKSGLHSIRNKLLKGVACLYYRLSRECKLLHIQYRQEGLSKMFFTYASFRLKSLKEKM